MKKLMVSLIFGSCLLGMSANAIYTISYKINKDAWICEEIHTDSNGVVTYTGPANSSHCGGVTFHPSPAPTMAPILHHP